MLNTFTEKGEKKNVSVYNWTTQSLTEQMEIKKDNSLKEREWTGGYKPYAAKSCLIKLIETLKN